MTARRAMFGAASMVLAIVNAHAQVVDSSHVGIAPLPSLDTLPSTLTAAIPKPPVSPSGALFRSLLVPGWGQASLDRGTAGAIFAGVEVMSLAMLAQANAELRAAQRVAGDSIYQPGSNTFIANPLAQVVGKRQAAVEDWKVLLLFNHLISAADAFVAAHLWNVPVQVHGSASQLKATVSTSVRW